MFHVEQRMIREWALKNIPKLSLEQENRLNSYARMIFDTNKKYNLTGLKSLESIIKTLVIGSLEPLIAWNVPRGTRFADMGSGSGIPGIPIGIFFDVIQGILFEADKKKADFISYAIKELGLSNLEVCSQRVEELGRGTAYRETFDWVLARAFGSIYTVLELGLPFLNVNGYLYIYSNLIFRDVPVEMIKHAERLGASFIAEDMPGLPKLSPGILLVKKNITPTEFPRRYSVVRREAGRFEI